MSHSQTARQWDSETTRQSTCLNILRTDGVKLKLFLSSSRFLSRPKLLMMFRPVSHHCLQSGDISMSVSKLSNNLLVVKQASRLPRKLPSTVCEKWTLLSLNSIHLPKSPPSLMWNLICLVKTRWEVECRDRLRSRLAPGLRTVFLSQSKLYSWNLICLTVGVARSLW